VRRDVKSFAPLSQRRPFVGSRARVFREGRQRLAVVRR
jgi:hypothetical protein